MSTETSNFNYCKFSFIEILKKNIKLRFFVYLIENSCFFTDLFPEITLQIMTLIQGIAFQNV